VELGLPVGFSCEVVLENRIQVRGRLGLDDEGLFHSASRREKLRIGRNQLLRTYDRLYEGRLPLAAIVLSGRDDTPCRSKFDPIPYRFGFVENGRG